MKTAITEELIRGSGEGFFGAYGGRFVAETLMAPLEELTAAFEAARRDPEFQRELAGLLADFSGRPTPLYYAESLSRRTRRRARLPEARRPGPHRLAQDQQRARAGAAGAAHGQAAHHRGNRRRPARRGHGHGVRPLRPGVRGVHGLGRHEAPGAECLPHAADGRRGARRREPAHAP